MPPKFKKIDMVIALHNKFNQLIPDHFNRVARWSILLMPVHVGLSRLALNPSLCYISTIIQVFRFIKLGIFTDIYEIYTRRPS